MAAAGEVGPVLGLEITVLIIGPGGDYEGPYGDWVALREVGDTGCVLVRPDKLHRASVAQLAPALRQILALDC